MNVLITGGTGNLGSRLLVPLVQRGDRLTIFDVQSQPRIESREFQEAELIQGDLGDRQALLGAVERGKIESIFHLGAVLSASAENHPAEAWRANMEGMANVLDAARSGGAARVIFSSTVATFGGQAGLHLNDDAPQWPSSLYGVTKVAGERLGVYYQQRFGLDFRCIRLPAVIAPYGSGGGASAYCSAAFEQSVTNGKYDFYVRRTTRMPMLYIADAIRGLLDLHDASAKRLSRRVYNSSGISPSAEELAQAIHNYLPAAAFTYTPDALRTAIVESWPHDIDDSAARRDWDWRAEWDLDHIARDVIGALQQEHASQ